jgi:hypothetical protein
VRRHKAITALAAAVLLATVLGVAGIAWKYRDAEQQKTLAQKKAALSPGNLCSREKFDHTAE